MSDIFEFVKNLYSQQINSQFRSEDPNNKIWYRNIKNMSQMNIMNENENLFKKKKKKNENLFPNEYKAFI